MNWRIRTRAALALLLSATTASPLRVFAIASADEEPASPTSAKKAEPGPPASQGPSQPAPPIVQANAEITAIVKLDSVLRASPDDAAAFIGTARAGSTVRVSVDVMQGYRRVYLPDGSNGYVKESQLDVAQTAIGRNLAVPIPTTYMRDLDHLESFTMEDPAVGERVKDIRHKRSAAIALDVAAIGSLIAGFVVAKNNPDCTMQGRYEVCTANYTPALTGSLIGLGLSLIAWGIWPARAEYVDAVNLWNRSHPERPIGMD